MDLNLFSDMPKGGLGTIETQIMAGSSILGYIKDQFESGYTGSVPISHLITNDTEKTFNDCSKPMSTLLGINIKLITNALEAQTTAIIDAKAKQSITLKIEKCKL